MEGYVLLFSRLRWPPARAGARQRTDQVLRARLARARVAQGAPEGDGGRNRRHAAVHRRQGNPLRRHREVGDAARSPARARSLPQGHRAARRAGDRGRRGRPRRMEQLGVRGSRGRDPQGRRAADDDLARHDQRRDDARAVQDRVPGGDRRRRGARRLLALQRALRAGAARRTAVQRPHDVEPARVPRPRGVRLRRHAVQLHVDRRQPADGAGADGQHGHLEAGVERDVLRLLPDEAVRGGRHAARRHQLRRGRLVDDLEGPALAPRSGRRALHRQHRRLQQHVEDDRRLHVLLPLLPAHRRRDGREGLHRRAPVGRRGRARGGDGARRRSSSRDRNARRRAASTCRSRSGTACAIARWR